MLNNYGEISRMVNSKPVHPNDESNIRRELKRGYYKDINRLIHTCLAILSVFSLQNAENLSQNEVYRRVAKIGKDELQTGLQFKRKIIDAIKLLEKNNIIRINKKRQTYFVNLTALGIEISKMIKYAQQYTDAYFKFDNSIKEKVLVVETSSLYLFDLRYTLDHDDKDVLQSKKYYTRKLKNIGWKENEITLYNKIRSTMLELKNIFDTNYINILIMRYALINDIKLPPHRNFRRTHDLPSKEAQQIISNIVMEMINKKVRYVLDNVGEELFQGYSLIRDIGETDNGRKIELYKQTLGPPRFKWFFDVYNIFKSGIICFLTQEDLKTILNLYFFLSRPNLGNLEPDILYLIDKFRTETLHLEKDHPKHADDSIKKDYIRLNLDSIKFFLDTYKEYCSENGYNSSYIDLIDVLLTNPKSLPPGLSYYSYIQDYDRE
jgi:hypothetical protein